MILHILFSEDLMMFSMYLTVGILKSDGMISIRFMSLKYYQNQKCQVLIL